MKREENSLGWYGNQSKELIIENKATIKTEEIVRPEEFKRMMIEQRTMNNEREKAWKKKKVHGQYIREKGECIDKGKTRR